MHVRPLAFTVATAALFIAGQAAHAASVTTSFYSSYSVGLTGVSKSGSTTNSRFGYVGGNATTSTGSTTFPSFEVYEVDGASVLSAFRASIFNSTGTVTSVDSLSLLLYDEATTGTAGGFSFAYASAASTPATGSNIPVYDRSAVGGLTTQLGTPLALGTGTYTPPR